MGPYILRRLALMIPTLFGIMLLNFVLIQFVPGGPVEQILARLQDGGGEAGVEAPMAGEDGKGTRGLPPGFLEDLKQQFGFDRPAHERFLLMLGNYLTGDFGQSYFRSTSVVDLVLEKMPVSVSLGLWSTLLAYLVSIPLGIRKAVRAGTAFDSSTSAIIIAANAIPGFLFGILLLVVFAGGSYFQWFPNRGLHSDGAENLALLPWIADYFWHLALPLIAYTVGSFATLTLLTKNSFLDEISKQYVLTARAKGLTERRVLYGHVFRNAMLIVISGFPGLFIAVFFGGSLIIENIFSLDGLGRLGYESVVRRDYPVVFGTLFVFSVVGLLVGLLSDLTYMLVDPRIDFERREV